MTSTPAAPTTSTDRPTTRQRVGLAAGSVFALLQLPSALVPGAPDGTDGAPIEVLVACSVVGLVGAVAGLLGWRSAVRYRTGSRVLAVCILLVLLSSLPALFVDVPTFVKVGVAASVVWVLGSLVLLFGRPRN